MSLSGLFVPLITPFTENDSVDLDALEKLAGTVLAAGAAGLVSLGTTAEAATLTSAERLSISEVCGGVAARHHAHHIIGVGSNSTSETMRVISQLTPDASAALVTTPSYTRPTEDGVVEHFRRVATSSPVPVVVYHVPHRTAMPLSAPTLLRLAEIPNICGFKYAAGTFDDTAAQFLAQVPRNIDVLSGDDALAGATLALGGSGAILASACLATEHYADMVNRWRCGEVSRARALTHALVPLSLALFAEPNPVVIKAVLAAQRRIQSPSVRLPLLRAGSETTQRALAALTELRTG